MGIQSRNTGTLYFFDFMREVTAKGFECLEFRLLIRRYLISILDQISIFYRTRQADILASVLLYRLSYNIRVKSEWLIWCRLLVMRNILRILINIKILQCFLHIHLFFAKEFTSFTSFHLLINTSNSSLSFFRK